MKKRVGALFMLLALVCALPCSTLSTEQPQAVSIIQLISSPDAYDGKLVQVFGFVRFEFEGSAIYLHQEDYKQGLYKNSLWLSMGEQKELDQKYALIEGIFNARNHGHLGLCSGSIEKVSRSMPWPPKRSNPSH
jgi:hypothetical protein